MFVGGVEESLTVISRGTFVQDGLVCPEVSTKSFVKTTKSMVVSDERRRVLTSTKKRLLVIILTSELFMSMSPP